MPETVEEVTLKRTPEELTQLFHLLEEALVDSAGEVTVDTQLLLDTLEIAGKDMVDRYASFVRHLQARGKALREQVKVYGTPLLTKATSAEALADKLMTRVHQHMTATNKSELVGDFRSVRLQPSPEALEITEAGKVPGALPEEYYFAPTIDTGKVKAAVKLAGGVLVDDVAKEAPVVLARLTRGTHARIY